MGELKPCPFCGSDDISVTETMFREPLLPEPLNIIESSGFHCTCNECAAETSIEETIEEAIAVWNRRAKQKRIEELKDALLKLRALIRSENMPDMFDVTDDATTELAVECAYLRAEVERLRDGEGSCLWRQTDCGGKIKQALNAGGDDGK